MAGQKPSAAANADKPAQIKAEYSEARRQVLAMLRVDFPRLQDGEEVADGALEEAVRKWDGRAAFSTYALTLARYRALDAIERSGRGEIDQGTSVEEVADTDASIDDHDAPRLTVPRGDATRLGLLLDRFVDARAGEIEGYMFLRGDEDSSPVEVLRDAIAVALPRFLAENGLGMPWKLDFDRRFDEQVRKYGDRVARLTKAPTWVESLETLSERPAVVGRPSPAATWPEVPTPKDLEQGFYLGRVTAAFDEKRAAAARGLVLYAMKRAGIPGKELNHFLKKAAQTRARARAKQRADLIEAVREVSERLDRENL